MPAKKQSKSKSSSAKRVKRVKPRRQAPIRNAALAFRAPEPPREPETEPSVIHRGVDDAYRVIEEYMKEGQQAARHRAGQASASMYSWWNLVQPLLHSVTQFTRMGRFGGPQQGFSPYPPTMGPPGPGMAGGQDGTWGNIPWMTMQWLWTLMSWMQAFGSQGPFANNPGSGSPYTSPSAPPGDWGRDTGPSFPWYPPTPPPGRSDEPTGFDRGIHQATPDGISNGRAWGPSVAPGGALYAVSISSVRPAEVVLDLHDRFAATRDLVIHDLRVVHGDAVLPRSAVELARADGRIRVELTISPDQSPGSHVARLVDKQSGVECGALRISIGNAPA